MPLHRKRRDHRTLIQIVAKLSSRSSRYKGVSVQAVISVPKNYYTAAGDLDPTTRRGAELVSQIEVMREPSSGFGAIDVRIAVGRSLHDRFLRIDDELWHCGHSFNGVGFGSVSLMSRVTSPAELNTLLDGIFDAGRSFEDWWSKRPAPPARTLLRRLGDDLRAAASRLDRLDDQSPTDDDDE